MTRQQQTDLRPQPFNMARLSEIRKTRGKHDVFQPFWDELEIILKCKNPRINEWDKMENDDVVLGEVWAQTIGEIYYRHTVHKFSYLYVKTNGLAIGKHGHYEPANGGKQIRKFKEWYVFPDGSIHFCGKDKEHQLFNSENSPIYVLSVKVGSNGIR